MDTPDMFDALRALSAADDALSEDFDVNVVTYNDGANYYVVFEAAKPTTALDPDYARSLAQQLWTAADEADSKQGGKPTNPKRGGKGTKKSPGLWSLPTTRDGE